MSLAADDAIVLHPGPMNRGIEISTELAESSRCVVNEQKQLSPASDGNFLPDAEVEDEIAGGALVTDPATY